MRASPPRLALGLGEAEGVGALGVASPPASGVGDGWAALSPAQVTGIVRPSPASTTVAKSVATVTGTFTTSPAALPSQTPTTVTSTLACPAPSVVMTEAASEACASTRELSTSATACAPPALTRTFEVMEGPSEKDRPRSGIVTVEPSATASVGRVRPMEDLASRGLSPPSAWTERARPPECAPR